jgi:phytoene dehydrogenase-like protein
VSGAPCDAIIIGGGHNGLTCAAYLAGAGKRVRVFEARPVVGGAAVTEEFAPGFRNSSCSYVLSMMHPSIQRDLELARHGLSFRRLEHDFTVPMEDGRVLALPGRVDTDVARLDALHGGDGQAYVEFERLLGEIADVIREAALQTPPNLCGGLLDLLRLARQVAGVRHLSLAARSLFAKLLTSSAGAVLDQWFGGDAIKGVLAYHGCVGNFQSPYAPGTAYVLLHHVFGEATGVKGAWAHVRGGMGAVSAAIAASARARGAEIEVAAPVARVLVEAGRARGVELADGRQFEAQCVVSAVHPKILFERLLDSGSLPTTFRRDIKGYRSGSATLRMNVALDEVPQFPALPGPGVQPHHRGSIVFCPSIAYLEQAWLDARTTGLSRHPVIEMWIASTVDDTLAPPGKHVASLFCQHFNPRLPDGRSWDELREAAADRVIATVTRFAPNFAAAVIARKTWTPLDLERDFHLVDGDIFHGALHLDQMYSLRPAAGYADYGTPLAGLFMCASGTHPGGGVSGMPGRNASREILRRAF